MREENNGASSHDLDSFDDVAFQNSLDQLEAVQDLREDGELVIESRVVDKVNEDLRVTGVASACRDPERPAHVRPLSELVSHERSIADVFVRARASALNHEVRLNTMKRQAIVVPGTRKLLEPKHAERRLET